VAGAFRVEGGRKIKAVGQALRHLGTDRTIVNEMTKEIRRQFPQVRRAIKASAKEKLPKRGGLNRWVAASSVRVSVRRGARAAGMRIVVGRNSQSGKRSDIKRLDAGTTRAPLFGNAKHWYPHSVTPGFATTVVDTDVYDEFVKGAERAVDKAVEEVLRAF